MAPRSDWRFSARPVMNGSTVNRVSDGTAVMTPIHDGVDADRLQPHRKKRQMRADEAEQRAVKQRQPRRESLRPQLAKRWGFVSRTASIQLRFACVHGDRISKAQ